MSIIFNDIVKRIHRNNIGVKFFKVFHNWSGGDKFGGARILEQFIGQSIIPLRPG